MNQQHFHFSRELTTLNGLRYMTQLRIDRLTDSMNFMRGRMEREDLNDGLRYAFTRLIAVHERRIAALQSELNGYREAA